MRLRVTLSHFVEPNPSSRGWQGRYRYASHGLRFDVKRPTETLEDFRKRLGNAAAREEGDDTPQPETSVDDRWYIGSRYRNSGSLHADIWIGSGAQLADSGYIGVTPVGGWWKDNNRKDRANLPVRYALLVSLQTDAVATDIYTPIATKSVSRFLFRYNSSTCPPTFQSQRGRSSGPFSSRTPRSLRGSCANSRYGP